VFDDLEKVCGACCGSKKEYFKPKHLTGDGWSICTKCRGRGRILSVEGDNFVNFLKHYIFDEIIDKLENIEYYVNKRRND
jgi:hypothetical protein